MDEDNEKIIQIMPAAGLVAVGLEEEEAGGEIEVTEPVVAWGLTSGGMVRPLVLDSSGALVDVTAEDTFLRVERQGG